MILNQFKQALSDFGVTPFDSLGMPFDPHRHDAVEICPTDQMEPGLVMEEFCRGYQMGDRVVRHAAVKVSAEINEETNNG